MINQTLTENELWTKELVEITDNAILTTDLRIRQFTKKEIDLIVFYHLYGIKTGEIVEYYSKTIDEPYFIEQSIAKYGDAIYRIPTRSEVEAVMKAFLLLQGRIGGQIAELIQDQHDIEDSKPLAFAEF